MVIRLARDVLCLDWDAKSLRMVVARRGGGGIVLEDAHSHRLPADLDPENAEALGEFIQQTMRRHRWSYTRAVVDIPREKAVINRLTLPPTPEHEVAAAVRFQAMKELPFPLDTAVIDYVVMKRDERGLTTEVLLAAVPLDALDALRKTCAAAGLEPARIGLRPYANLVSVAQLPGLAEQRVLFVDVGPTMTEIDVFSAGQLAFARSANVSVPLVPGEYIESEEATAAAAAPPETPSAAEIASAVRDVTVEMTRTLQAYRAMEPDAAIDRVVVGGGTGIEASLLSALGDRFAPAGGLFDPTGALKVDPAEAVKLRSFAAALGLAWGLGREPTLGIDFLNPKKPLPPGALLRRRVQVGAVAAGIVLAAALAVDLTMYLRQSHELAAQRRVNSDLRRQLVELYLPIENKVEEVQDWQTEAIWPEHLRQLSEAAVNPGDEMLVQQMSFDTRTASLNLKKVVAVNKMVPILFVARLNELEIEGTRPYRATLGGWRSLTGTNASKFQGAIDITVSLRDLKKHLEEREKREKARRDKLRGL